MELKVITYNIHRAIGIDRRFRPERIVRILMHHDADIVFLQEVDVGVPRSNLLDLAQVLAEEAGYPHHCLGLNVPLRRGAYGNATLSRFPLETSENIDLTVGKRKQRGCLYARIRIENGNDTPIDLATFNLHLGLSARERSMQVGTLARAARFAELSPETPCIVAGDFNDWRGLIPPVFTDIMGFGSATDSVASPRRSLSTYPSFSPTGGLDKIFFRGPIAPLWAGRCRLHVAKIASDHLPVEALFGLSEHHRRKNSDSLLYPRLTAPPPAPPSGTALRF